MAPSSGDAFAPVTGVARLMAGFDRPWFIAGGWAVDMFLERVTRPHEDIEIAILREDQEAIRRHLAGWQFTKVDSGTRGPWREGERLERPVHEIHARRASSRPAKIEILLNESEGGVWRFRRDPRVARPLSGVGLRSASGIPILSPEIVLLYKAKQRRERDGQDFRLLRPALSAEGRAWLRQALDIVHPGHPWIRELEGG